MQARRASREKLFVVLVHAPNHGTFADSIHRSQERAHTRREEVEIRVSSDVRVYVWCVHSGLDPHPTIDIDWRIKKIDLIIEEPANVATIYKYRDYDGTRWVGSDNAWTGVSLYKRGRECSNGRPYFLPKGYRVETFGNSKKVVNADNDLCSLALGYYNTVHVVDNGVLIRMNAAPFRKVKT